MPYFSTNLEKTMDRLMISMILNTQKIKIRRAALKKENLVKKKVTAAMIQLEMRKLLISIWKESHSRESQKKEISEIRKLNYISLTILKKI